MIRNQIEYLVTNKKEVAEEFKTILNNTIFRPTEEMRLQYSTLDPYIDSKTRSQLYD